MHYIITIHGYMFVTFHIISCKKTTFFFVSLNFFAEHKKSPVRCVGQGKIKGTGNPSPTAGCRGRHPLRSTI